MRYEMLAAEDARPITRAEAAPLLRGLGSPSPIIARLAVRGLGRLERREFLADIRRALSDSDPLVRAEAANALAQAAAGDPAMAWSALRARLESEKDPAARAALLDAIARLPFESPGARVPVERALATALAGEFSPVAVRLAAARGLATLLRRARGTPYTVSADTLAVLRQAAVGTARPIGVGEETRVRRAAVLALNEGGAVDGTYERIVLDRDDQVRRLAIAGVAGNAPSDYRERLVLAGLRDASPIVRYEALRVHGRHLASTDCAPEIAALDDPGVHVALLAIDLLATACLANAGATDRLVAIVSTTGPSLAAQPDEPARAVWLAPSRALVALARRAPDRARPLLAGFATLAVWQARVYAARAAATLGGADELERLTQDAHANVRAAAIDGLRQVKSHEADAIYLAALDKPDYQVVMSAVGALEGTPAKDTAAAALLRALQALTTPRRDTSRDARISVLERVREVGDATRADALAPYTADFDPRVAARAAEILTAWTGTSTEIKTTRLTTLPAPPREELLQLPASLRVTMANGQSFDVRLFAADTPFTVWRVARLVKQGYYNGLTYHRIVPNFIIQGGSPGADEFVGDGPFMRDELVPRSHDRGTLGISTRGRDTGDAQWFINMVDNPRLDHDYTIFGEVVAGMEVVDAIVEGDVMRTVELLPRAQVTGPAPGRLP